MFWAIVCGENKILFCSVEILHSLWNVFLEDNKDRNKKFNKSTQAAETLQSEIAQVAVTFSGLQRPRNSSIRKHH